LREILNVSELLRQTKRWKSASAFLLAGLVLFLSAAGASPSLHRWIHPDASSADHQCVITLFTKGHVSSAPVIQIVVGPLLVFGGILLLAETFVLPSANYRFSSSRAPPSLSARLA
jgi:hypothetical protein